LMAVAPKSWALASMTPSPKKGPVASTMMGPKSRRKKMKESHKHWDLSCQC
jgi:hypothetical protein